MGWYESPNHPGVMLGDEAFDVTYEGLRALSALYTKAHRRKPTLDELRVLLEIELEVAGAELLADLDERAVSQVTIKTAKKPRDQRYARGDVFAIPIGGGRHAFGRITALDKSTGMFVEIFAQTSERAAYSSAVVASGRLFQPVRMSGGRASLQNWRWTVVRSDPRYETPAEDAALEYAAPHPAGGSWIAVDVANEFVRDVSPAEARRMISGHYWSPEDVEERIALELRSKKRHTTKRRA